MTRIASASSVTHAVAVSQAGLSELPVHEPRGSVTAPILVLQFKTRMIMMITSHGHGQPEPDSDSEAHAADLNDSPSLSTVPA